MKEFIQGLTSYFSSISALFRYGLWKYILMTGLFSLSIGIILFIIGNMYVDHITDYMGAMLPEDSNSMIIETIVKWTIWISMILIFILLYKHLFYIIFGGFMGMFSLEVERRINGEISSEVNSELKLLIGDISFTFSIILKELFWLFLLFILAFIPLFTIIVPPLVLIVQSYYAGGANIGAYLSARKNNKTQINQFIKKHRGLAIGNGIGFVLLLMIPFFGLIFAPSLSIVALTLQQVKK